MLSVTSAQLDAWIAAFIFPLSRILGLLATAPVFSNPGMPRRTRLILGIAISIALAPALPPMPAVPAGSWVGLAILAQQALIGVLMGASLRIVFAAIDIAGDLIGLQMGLSFATTYDHQTAGQTAAITEFLSLLTTLTFLAMNGHLLTLSLLAESFNLIPVSATPFAAAGLKTLVASGATLFTFGLLLSLPMIATLMITNIGLGVLSKVSPQLNLFAVGFAVTLVVGFILLTFSMSYIGAALTHLFEQGFFVMGEVMKASRPAI